jgi:hypothetical protein
VLQPVDGLVDRLLLRLAIGRQSENAADREGGGDHQRIVLRHQQVLQHGHAAEEPDILERTSDLGLLRYLEIRHALEQEDRAAIGGEIAPPAGRDRVDRLLLATGAVAHHNAALGRLVETGHAVEHGRFTGAVWPDQRGDVAAADVEGKIVHRH